MEESENLYKLYGYGSCKGRLTPKIAEHKAQETLHVWYLKLLSLFYHDLFHHFQWLFQVPLKGGIGSIFHPPGSARTISGI